MSRAVAVPEGSVLLHIGPQKTGSTMIQQAMHEARTALAEHGVHYVGRRPVEKEAGWFVLGLDAAVGKRPPRPQAWQRVVDDLADTSLPRACLSNEDFGRADDAAIARILDATGRERTHLVYVARRLDKVLPSHWQQQVKARLTASYDDFLRDVLAPGAQTWASTRVMDPQDVGAVLCRWGRQLPKDRMTVVVADEGDPAALPRAFESLLALPPGLLEPPAHPANRSMGFAETEVVRRVNEVTRVESWAGREYRNLVQLGVVESLKQRLAPSPRLQGVPEWAFDRVADLADAQVAAIAASGAQVVGDPEHLRVRDNAAPADVPDELRAVDLDLLADVVSGLRAGALRMRPAARVDPRQLRDSLGGRQLVQLLARRTASRLGVRRG